MPPLALWILALVIAAAGIALALWVNLTPAERLAAGTAKRVGRPLPDPPLRERLSRRIRHTRRWITNTGVVALLLTLGALAAGAGTETLAGSSTALVWLLVGGIILGTTVGALLGVLTTSTDLEPDRPRVAHAVHTTLRDYLDPLELVGARIVTALAVLTALVTVTVLTSTEAGAGAINPATGVASIALASTAVVGLLAVELGGRRIVLTRPRLATDADALVWDDALRADELRVLVSAPIMTGLYGFLLGLPALAAAALDGVDRFLALVIVNAGAGILFLALLVIFVLSIVRKPARYYLRRLWPELTAGESGRTTP